MRIRAVVDQIEAGKALLLISSNERGKIIWPVKHLPEEIKEGDIVYINIEIDHEETKKIKEKAQDRLARLLKRTQEMEKKKD
ncbi:hypothetical protein BBF96_02000 [Anoxybacter fermentans]|uniref:Uncharacterized protein n=1 Tax=Anoxybacter fermentans TaxID=1323375 RepID=A0A3S9SVE0_9FIRM|nr:DUF3006 domain-containing protein [Anoxybacter fermentans]AZR72276.1 hypothetical protein BBF96_02000 [Anoxybacter fermentans]